MTIDLSTTAVAVHVALGGDAGVTIRHAGAEHHASDLCALDPTHAADFFAQFNIPTDRRVAELFALAGHLAYAFNANVIDERQYRDAARALDLPVID